MQGGAYSFGAVFGGSVRIGGRSGFVASLSGSVDIADGSETSAATFNFTHAGGWSPFTGELREAFTSPACMVSPKESFPRS